MVQTCQSQLMMDVSLDRSVFDPAHGIPDALDKLLSELGNMYSTSTMLIRTTTLLLGPIAPLLATHAALLQTLVLRSYTCLCDEDNSFTSRWFCGVVNWWLRPA